MLLNGPDKVCEIKGCSKYLVKYNGIVDTTGLVKMT